MQFTEMLIIAFQILFFQCAVMLNKGWRCYVFFTLPILIITTNGSVFIWGTIYTMGKMSLSFRDTAKNYQLTLQIS